MFRLSLLIYLLFSGFLLWPALSSLGQTVPGAEVSDLWNALWSIDFVVDSLLGGRLPTCTDQLNHPMGGCLWPMDIITSLIVLPLSGVFSLLSSYSLAVWIHLIVVGLSTEMLFRSLFPNAKDYQGMLAGLIMLGSTVVVTALHNGSSEALTIGWSILGMYGMVRFVQGGAFGLLFLIVSVFSSWYGVVGVILFSFCYWLSCDQGKGHRLLKAGALFIVLLLPYAWIVSHYSTGEDNLLLIKRQAELMQVRRTIGAADPFTYIVPWRYYSPNFSEISRYGEQFVHSAYLGLVPLGVFVCRLRSHPRWLLLLAMLGFLLSLGPVLVIQGEPILLSEGHAVPLPYLLLEQIPGFSSLTLLTRLAFVPMLCLALLVVRHLGKGGALCLALCVFVESTLFSPVRHLPSFTSVPEYKAIQSLREAPEGAVGYYPIVGGREGLYFQTLHRKPVASTLNFSLNMSTEKIFRVALKTEGDFDEMRRRIPNVAKQTGVRYLVVDQDPTLMPDHYSIAVTEIIEHFSTVGQAENDYIVVQLW